MMLCSRCEVCRPLKEAGGGARGDDGPEARKRKLEGRKLQANEQKLERRQVKGEAFNNVNGI